VKKQRLLSKNRLNNENRISPGLVLWLRYIRAADQPVEYVQLPEEVLSEASTETIPDEPGIKEGEVQNKEIEEDEIEEDEFTQIVEEIEEKPNLLLENDDPNIEEGLSEESVVALSDEELIELDQKKDPLFHLVEAGETLYAISRKYGISVNDILEINNLNVDDKISIGQKIYLRDPFGGNNDNPRGNANSLIDSYITYTVKKGDTLYSISKKYGVGVEDILKWNNKSDYNLKEGEQIKIKEL
jgi:membrane-bound lytic murein transglycosylase D